MIQTLIAWALIALLFASAYPLARGLLLRSPIDDGCALDAALTLSLAVGLLTLIMLVLGLLRIGFSILSVGLPYVLIVGIGGWLLNRGTVAIRQHGHGRSRYVIAAVLVGLVSLAVLFNAAYWPFSRDDALGIYVPFAQEMAGTRTLVPLTGADSLYRAYPMALPLAYAFTYIVSGWENEYLARTIPALLAIGCLPVAYLLGRRLSGPLAGWGAALLLATMPSFVGWASSGYVDLPMAFFYGLTALFCARLWDRGAAVDSLLAGVSLGLAAWTKNAALTGVPLLAIWLVWAWVRGRVSFVTALASLAVCALVAAPWYVRNLIGAGFIMPDTAWTDQAQRTVANLIPFISQPQNFSIQGWVVTAGILWAAARALRPGGAVHALLLWWSLPFLAVWWAFASYDPRFLLLFLPPLCALGGAVLAQAWTAVPPLWRPQLARGAAALALVLTLLAAFRAIEFKGELLRDPFMSHADKIALVRGG